MRNKDCHEESNEPCYIDSGGKVKLQIESDNERQ